MAVHKHCYTSLNPTQQGGPAEGRLEGVRTLAGYADTSGHGRVRFVISLTSNDDEMRFRLLRTIESGL